MEDRLGADLDNQILCQSQDKGVQFHTKIKVAFHREEFIERD